FELCPFLECDFGTGRPLIDPVLESPAMPIAARLIEIATPVAGGRGALDAVLAPIQQRTVRDPRWIEAIVPRWRHWLPVFAWVVMAEFKHGDSGSNGRNRSCSAARPPVSRPDRFPSSWF